MRGAPRLWAVSSWWARRALCCVLMLCDWLTKCPTGSVVDSWKPRLLLQNIKWGTFLTKASYCCPLNNSRTAYCISKKLYIYVLFKVSYFMHLKTSLGNWKKKSEQSKEVTKGERTRENTAEPLWRTPCCRNCLFWQGTKSSKYKTDVPRITLLYGDQS